MATFKCKICGGELNVTEGMKICECDYCGTKQTLPNLNDEKKTNLFNRANKLRMVNEFDKASGIYESIVAEFKDEPEAYWGLCLCDYGIEYVDDPKTAEKIPTCHRTSFDSILECDNYKKVIELSDEISKELYEKEAKQIDVLQKDILDIVKDEDPFDVFICYKESDASGDRTQDSVLAEDIYEKLTEKGFKVFFSRITLEDKLGKEYEPYIFAALNSAKVMLAIGTNEDNYNAVWVKNEWSRYFAMMQKDKSKNLIPCFKDMDPYDLPIEFKNLQGQDMNKVGFIQDLIRGINKVIKPEDQANYSAKVSVNNQIVDTMLVRAKDSLEKKDWDSAKRCCDNVLDYEPENQYALLYKVFADLKVTGFEQLSKSCIKLKKNKKFTEAYNVADNDLKTKLDDLLNAINTNIKNKKKKKFVATISTIIAISIIAALIYAIVPPVITKSEFNNIKNAKVGDIVQFGLYKQEDFSSKMESKFQFKEFTNWVVLDKQEDRVLLISQQPLELKSFYSECSDITWDSCTLRTWLNNDFYNTSFNYSERSKIQTTKVSADKNPQYKIKPGNDTEDKVFLLSIKEANKYFKSDFDRQCRDEKT